MYLAYHSRVMDHFNPHGRQRLKKILMEQSLTKHHFVYLHFKLKNRSILLELKPMDSLLYNGSSVKCLLRIFCSRKIRLNSESSLLPSFLNIRIFIFNVFVYRLIRQQICISISRSRHMFINNSLKMFLKVRYFSKYVF